MLNAQSVTPPSDDRSEMLAAAAKRKFLKYQNKKASHVASMAAPTDNESPPSPKTASVNKESNEVASLKETLAQLQNQLRRTELELEKVKKENAELHRLVESEVLSDPMGFSFADGHMLESYEAEERAIIEEARLKLFELRERYMYSTSDLCGGCVGELLEI